MLIIRKILGKRYIIRKYNQYTYVLFKYQNVISCQIRRTNYFLVKDINIMKKDKKIVTKT